MSDFIGDNLRQMPLARSALDQDNLANTNDPAFTITSNDLHFSVKVDDILLARRWMPVEVIVRERFAMRGWELVLFQQ